MSQIMYNVGTSVYGSRRAVVGSGVRSRSDAAMPWKPRMDEPSNPTPSNVSSSKSEIERVVCCHVPRRSQKRKSTNLPPLSAANFTTSLGELVIRRVLPFKLPHQTASNGGLPDRSAQHTCTRRL